MAKFDYDIGVIGGGAAGLTVTAGAARLGAKTLLVEKETSLGGDCLHYGCVPSKTLIRTAEVYHLMTLASRFGLPDVEPPPVDFSKVAERIRSVIRTIQAHDSEERFCSLGARVEHGEPKFTDEHTIDLSGKAHTAQQWVIATGSSPGIPPIEGLGTTGYLTNKELFSLDHLPSSLIVLGAGPIGSEMAQAFRRLGSRVTVVQRSGRILSREDEDMAAVVLEALRSEGVTVRLNATVAGVSDLGHEREVRITDGDGAIVPLRAEAVLVAMGRTPNVEGLGLEGIGVDYTRTGIAVDARMRTSRKHIHAAGDVTGAHQFTPRGRLRGRDRHQQRHISSAPQGRLHVPSLVHLYGAGTGRYRDERDAGAGRRPGLHGVDGRVQGQRQVSGGRRTCGEAQTAGR